MPSKLDPHRALIEGWLAAEPWLTAIAIVGRLAELHPDQFGNKQHSIVQRLLEPCARAPRRDFSLRERRAAPRGCGRLGYAGPDPTTAPPGNMLR